MRFLKYALFALIAAAAMPAAALAAGQAPAVVYATVGDVNCASVLGDTGCARQPNISVQAVTYGGLTGAASYVWEATCPGTPDASFYVQPTGATTGCFKMVGIGGAVYPKMGLSAFASLSAADTACAAQGRPCYLDKSVTLAANTTLTAKWVCDGGVITLGTYNLSGDFSTARTLPCFDLSGAGIFTPAVGDALTPENVGYTGSNLTSDTADIRALFNANVTQILLGHPYYINNYIAPAYWNAIVDRGAQFVQTASDVPILEPYGEFSGSTPQFPQLIYQTAQTALDPLSVAFVTNAKSGVAGGLYHGNFINLYARYASVGVYNPPALSTNVSAAASIGATTLTIATTSTGVDGAFGAMPGTWWTLTADDGTTTSDEQITSISGSTITVTPALPFAVSGTSTNTFKNDTNSMFSDNITAYVRDASVSFGWFAGGRTLTKFNMLRGANTYAAPESPFTVQTMSSYPWYFEGGINDMIDGVNVEHAQTSKDAIFLDENSSVPGAFGPRFTNVHIESINFLSGGVCIFGGRVTAAEIGMVEIHQMAALTANVSTNPACVFGFDAPTGTNGKYAKTSTITVAGLRIAGTIMDGRTNIVMFRDRDNSGAVSYRLKSPPVLGYGSNMTMKFNLNYSGQYLLRGIDGLLPPDSVGYLPDAMCSDTTAHEAPILNASDIIDHIYVARGRPAIASGFNTATMGIYSDAGTTLISSSATTALSPILDGSNYVDLGVTGIPANSTTSNGVTYYKCAGLQGNGPAVGSVSQTSYSGGLTGSVGYIQFSVAPGWPAGTAFLGGVAGSTHAILNESYVWINMTSATTAEYSILTSGGDAAIPLGADSAVTVTHYPTFSLIYTGEPIGAMAGQ